MRLPTLGLRRRGGRKPYRPKQMPDKQFSDARLADLYDLGNAGAEDRNFYIALAGNQPIDILDLGCGTGLLCLEYARAGHRVVGVDPAHAMLDVARRNDTDLQVEWVEAYAEAFETDKRFDLITMTGHAFQVLLADEQVTKTLSVMSELLKEEGCVVFESRNPACDWDKIWARDYSMQTKDGPVLAKRRLTDRSRAPEFLSFAWDYHFVDQVLTSNSTLRFLGHDEIVERANQADLQLIALYGDWDSSEFAPHSSKEMIFKFGRKPTS